MEIIIPQQQIHKNSKGGLINEGGVMSSEYGIGSFRSEGVFAGQRAFLGLTIERSLMRGCSPSSLLAFNKKVSSAWYIWYCNYLNSTYDLCTISGKNSYTLI